MKIVRKPLKRCRKVLWWVGKVLTCYCTTKFKLEEGDKVENYQDIYVPGIKVKCPTCKEVVFCSQF